MMDRVLTISTTVLCALSVLSGGELIGAVRLWTRDSTSKRAPRYTFEVVRDYRHDPEAFTQGLLYANGSLFESTGLTGRSTIREVRVETGQVLRLRSLDREYFGEGLARWRSNLIQVTWRSHTGFLYHLPSLDPVRTFTYQGEGWGLASDDKRLIMSDGTAWLRFLDPESFAEVGRVWVHDGQNAVDRLNELEVIGDKLYANVWPRSEIAIIDMRDGAVTGWLDCSALLPEFERPRVDAMNGIAYDAEHRRLFVTGKLWPRVYEIRVTNGLNIGRNDRHSTSDAHPWPLRSMTQSLWSALAPHVRL